VIGLLQRVSMASVRVDSETIGQIDRGLLVLVGAEKGDSEPQADRLLERLLGYRVFPDGQGKMNRSLTDIGGGLLLVPQFTLPPTPVRECVLASLLRPIPGWLRIFSTICCNAPGSSMTLCRVGGLAPICRSPW